MYNATTDWVLDLNDNIYKARNAMLGNLVNNALFYTGGTTDIKNTW